MNLYLLTFLVSVGFNLLMFAPAYIWKTDKLTDLSYSLTFAALTFWLFLIHPVSPLSIGVLVMVSLWSLRLGGYLFVRIHKMKRDKRFDTMRENFASFLRFWLLQGISVPFVLFGVTSLFAAGTSNPITTLSIIGAALFLSGLLIETIADIQKYTLINNPANRGKWIDRGLWHYSRHPNYFGEILVWIGVFLFVLPSLSGWTIAVAAVSPLYIFGLIRWVSGVPLLEKSAQKRWGKDPKYRQYCAQTSLLVPFFPKKH